MTHLGSELTDRQWYAVCKFFPAIAARSHALTGRRLADVGPHNPLDSVVCNGPFLALAEAAAERAAIQSETA